ncbi:MAG: hypothetical protein KJO07_11885 [Deltaproteobacteria bacterium]|nr:hypothetical protein [Deltaproteobacteria bacterium]
MSIFRVSIVLPFALALSSTACSDDGVDSDLDSFVVSQERIVDRICECTDDTPECRDNPDAQAFDPDTIDCFREVLVANEEVSGVPEATSCLAAAFREAADCFDEASCSDQTAFQSCGAAFVAAEEACPEVPLEVEQMLDACDPE